MTVPSIDGLGHVQRPGIEPGWLNLEARNLPLDQNAPPQKSNPPDHVDAKAKAIVTIKKLATRPTYNNDNDQEAGTVNERIRMSYFKMRIS